ncbi:hypothetical protein ACWD25_51665 [Streptomyces sp. NPDC002920]
MVEMKAIAALVIGPVAVFTGVWQTPLGAAAVWAVISAGSRSYIRYQRVRTR